MVISMGSQTVYGFVGNRGEKFTDYYFFFPVMAMVVFMAAADLYE